jgi:hypothetical protein
MPCRSPRRQLVCVSQSLPDIIRLQVKKLNQRVIFNQFCKKQRPLVSNLVITQIQISQEGRRLTELERGDYSLELVVVDSGVL